MSRAALGAELPAISRCGDWFVAPISATPVELSPGVMSRTTVDTRVAVGTKQTIGRI